MQKMWKKKFGIYNNPLIGKNKQFLQEIMDKIPGIIKIGYQSLRKISKYFEIFLGIRVSHQTIKNWSNKNHKETINNEEFEIPEKTELMKDTSTARISCMADTQWDFIISSNITNKSTSEIEHALIHLDDAKNK